MEQKFHTLSDLSPDHVAYLRRRGKLQLWDKRYRIRFARTDVHKFVELQCHGLDRPDDILPRLANQGLIEFPWYYEIDKWTMVDPTGCETWNILGEKTFLCDLDPKDGTFFYVKDIDRPTSGADVVSLYGCPTADALHGLQDLECTVQIISY